MPKKIYRKLKAQQQQLGGNKEKTRQLPAQKTN